MHLFDETETLTRYLTTDAILRAHATVRLKWYAQRLASKSI